MKICRRTQRALSLVEMLVVLAILAAVAGLVTLAVLKALAGQEERQCLNNLVLIEAAKDEYARDHPDATTVDPAEYRRLFRFGGPPRCPRNPNADYPGWDDLRGNTTCPYHPNNSAKVRAP